MLIPATTDSLWSVIRRLERTVAEQGRRGTAAGNAGVARASSEAGIAAEPLAAASENTITWQADSSTDWSTVFESITAKSRSRLSLYCRMRLDAAGPGAFRIRILLGQDEFTFPLSQSDDGGTFTAVGPCDVGEPEPGVLRLVRVQLSAAPGATATIWPPWLIWHNSPGTPPLAA